MVDALRIKLILLIFLTVLPLANIGISFAPVTSVGFGLIVVVMQTQWDGSQKPVSGASILANDVYANSNYVQTTDSFGKANFQLFLDHTYVFTVNGDSSTSQTVTPTTGSSNTLLITTQYSGSVLANQQTVLVSGVLFALVAAVVAAAHMWRHKRKSNGSDVIFYPKKYRHR